jgi:hypothetical protein
MISDGEPSPPIKTPGPASTNATRTTRGDRLRLRAPVGIRSTENVLIAVAQIGK